MFHYVISDAVHLCFLSTPSYKISPGTSDSGSYMSASDGVDLSQPKKKQTPHPKKTKTKKTPNSALALVYDKPNHNNDVINGKPNGNAPNDCEKNKIEIKLLLFFPFINVVHQ